MPATSVRKSLARICGARTEKAAGQVKARQRRVCTRHTGRGKWPPIYLYGPGCDCRLDLHGRYRYCQKGCITNTGSPARKNSQDCHCVTSNVRRCATGCTASDGQRAVKFGPDCHCARATLQRDVSGSTGKHCGKGCLLPDGQPAFKYGSGCSCIVLGRFRPATAPSEQHQEKVRAANSNAKRIARRLDREASGIDINSKFNDVVLQLSSRGRVLNRAAFHKSMRSFNPIMFRMSVDPMSLVDAAYLPCDISAYPSRRIWTCPAHNHQPNAVSHPCTSRIDLFELIRGCPDETSPEKQTAVYGLRINEAIYEHLHSHAVNYFCNMGLRIHSKVPIDVIRVAELAVIPYK